MLKEGKYPLKIDRKGYTGITDSVDITSDTTLTDTLMYDPRFDEIAQVTMQLLDKGSGEPVFRVLISYGEHQQLTNSSGMAVMEQVRTGYFVYETGTRAFDITSGFKAEQPIKELLELFKALRNKIYLIKEPEPKMLNLERIGERQKLFFVYGGRRIEIGDSLSEPEREWLYEIIKEHK